MSLALFRVGNFLSINDTIELSFIPDEEFGTEKGCVEDGFLQIAALFGANASGKTNIVLAFDYLRYLIVGEHSLISTKNIGRLNGDVSCPFNESSVTHFELFFKSIHLFNLSYVLDFDSSKGEVIKETLTLYESDSDGIILLERIGSEFVLNPGSMTDGFNAAQTLLDKVGLKIGMPVIHQLVNSDIDWPPTYFVHMVLDNLYILASNDYEYDDIYSYHGIDDLRIVLDFLVELTDVSDAYLSNPDELPTIVCHFSDQLSDHEYALAHNSEKMQLIDVDDKRSYDILFAIGSENKLLMYTHLSSGVKRIIDVVLRILSTKIKSTSPAVDEKIGITVNMIEHSKTKPYTYVYDEICYALHPTIVNRLIEKLLREEPNSQFIMTFHESEFLISDDIRKDEIWFVKKDDNQTTVESLSQFDCSESSDVKNEYLNNRFEGTPRFSGGLD